MCTRMAFEMAVTNTDIQPKTIWKPMDFFVASNPSLAYLQWRWWVLCLYSSAGQVRGTLLTVRMKNHAEVRCTKCYETLRQRTGGCLFSRFRSSKASGDCARTGEIGKA